MQLAGAWPPFLAPARWVGLLAAAAQHDDEQASCLTRARRPPRPHARRHPGLHLSPLYEPLRGSGTKTTAFLDEPQAADQTC